MVRLRRSGLVHPHAASAVAITAFALLALSVNNSTTQGDAGFAQTNTVVRPRTFTFGVRYQF